MKEVSAARSRSRGLTKYVAASTIPTPSTMGSAIATPFVADPPDSVWTGAGAAVTVTGRTPLMDATTISGGGRLWRGMCMVCWVFGCLLCKLELVTSEVVPAGGSDGA